jgi:DNA topoisomerase-6 subunit B
MSEKEQSSFKDYKKTELTEYFYKNKHMLGFSYPGKSLIIAVHELLTNSIDNCISLGIKPNIIVSIEYEKDFIGKPDQNSHLVLTVEDNGSGIPKKFLPTIFSQLLQGSKFNVNKQHMGQQGIGGSAVVLFSKVTTGKDVDLVTVNDKKRYYCTIGLDIHTAKSLNKIIKEEPANENEHGTKIIVHLADVSFSQGKTSVDEYIKLIFLANPFVTINYTRPDKTKEVYKAIAENPVPPQKELPHPLGLSSHDLISLFNLSKHTTFGDFFTKDLQKTSAGLLTSLSKSTGLSLSGMKKTELTFQKAELIIKALQELKIKKPSSTNLMPIGEETLMKSLKELFQPDFSVVISRPPKVFNGGIPFEVEIGLGWGGNCGKQTTDAETYDYDLIRFANRAPLLFDLSHDVSYSVMKNINIRSYIKIETQNIPLSVIVNVNSPNVPFTGPSKMAIDNADEIQKEINLALLEGFRKISVFVNKKHRDLVEQKAKEKLSSYVEIVAENLEEASDGYAKKAIIKEHLLKIIKNR